MSANTLKNLILEDYLNTRSTTDFLCESLETEDFVVQPIVDVSPLKWHLAHTTWFFETFVLKEYKSDYKLFNDRYPYLFNSYYVSAGERWTRASRGQLTRPTVKEIFAYRNYVDEHLTELMQVELTKDVRELIILGINHEQQHQELFLYDIKRILGDNPLMPIFRKDHEFFPQSSTAKNQWLQVDEGLYEIGFEGDGFHFDNEKGRHKAYLHAYEIGANLVTNGEFIEFIEANGYGDFRYWLSEAWDFINQQDLSCPRYWENVDGVWHHYTLNGFEKVNLNDPVCHVSYYEADAFARWKGCKIPTEQEWEVAASKFSSTDNNDANFLEGKFFRPIQTGGHDFYGNVWEWTSSAYLPYPYFEIQEGAIGEYNGKFMINQMVLRGGSFATSRNHIRSTYRNFFHPNLRWLFSGIRLARLL